MFIPFPRRCLGLSPEAETSLRLCLAVPQKHRASAQLALCHKPAFIVDKLRWSDRGRIAPALSVRYPAMPCAHAAPMGTKAKPLAATLSTLLFVALGQRSPAF